MIRRRAYQIFECRGSEPGHELDDWLQAEREIKTIWVSRITSGLMRRPFALKCRSLDLLSLARRNSMPMEG